MDSKKWLLFSMSIAVGFGNQAMAASIGNDTAIFSLQQKHEKVSVSGVVTNGEGEALPGANVRIAGTTIGVITSLDGSFTLKVPVGSSLMVGFMGYTNKTIRITTAVSGLKVQLDYAHKVLDEIVVTGFGLSQKKASLTGSISAINSSELEKSISPNVSGALAGKVAGLNFRQTDGRPGSTTSLMIRNYGTPLYVIDGVVKDVGQFNNLDFNDIESISVLKDASAAIYGVRAGNGVIVVTTKKGKLNTPNTVTLNMYYGWQDPYMFPRPADTRTYLRNLIQSETIQGKTHSYTREEYDKWMNGTEKGYQGFDWYKYIWQKAPQYYANMNFTGGSSRINYYASLGYLNQDAAIHNYGGFKRYNAQINLDAQVTNRLKIGVSMNGRIEKKENPGVPGLDDYWKPVFATYHNLPTRRPFANDNPKYPQQVSNDPGTNFAILNYDKSGIYKSVWRVVQLNGYLEYELMKGLKAKALFGYYFADNRADNQEYSYKLYNYEESSNTYSVAYSMDNIYQERVYESVEELTSNIQLSYGRSFGSHNVNAVLGFESSQRSTPRSRVINHPDANSIKLIMGVSKMENFEDRGDNTQARLGYLMRLNYDYAGKYLVEFSGRYDGSWKFPPNHRWGFFPSASVGWRISEEAFWKDYKIGDIFNNLKIRASYGLVGDDNTAGYNPGDFLTGFNYGSGGGVIDGKYVVGSVPRGLPVTNISWLKSKILDIGLDVSVLQGHLNGSMDYFRRLLSGLPASRYDVVIPVETGFGLPKENLESDMTTGFDLSLQWNDQIGKNLTYYVGMNMTYSRKFTWDRYKPRFANSLDEYRNSPVHRFSDVIWGYKYDGQFKSWDEIANYPINIDGKGNTTLRPGDLKYKDLNGDLIINGHDQRPIGYYSGSNYNPNLAFGFQLGGSWKGIDVNIQFAGSAFASYIPGVENQVAFWGGGNNPQYLMKDTWHLKDIWDANSEIIAGKYPTMLEGTSEHSNYWKSDFWIKNMRYVKLRNLEIGYMLPADWMKKINIKSVRIYVAGQNLFTLSNISGVDPEIVLGSGLVMPTMRMINFGLTAKF